MPQHEMDKFGVYGTGAVLVPAGKTIAKNVIFDQSADFQVQKLTGWVTDQGDPPVVQSAPEVLLEWTDGGSGRSVLRVATPLSSILGSGELPFILPTPRKITRGSTMIWKISNLSAVAYTVYITMIGRDLFEV